MEFLELTDLALWKAVVCIVIPPLYWNIVAQTEYYTHTVSRLFCDKKKLAITVLAISICLLNVVRTVAFEEAVKSQKKLNPISDLVLYFGYFLIGVGQFFVWTSFYRLGFYATFLADYFGVFVHDAPIVSFPFNVISDPMYWGSNLSYFGIAVSQGSPAGGLLSIWVFIVYKLAIVQESKMLNLIYSKKSH